MAYPSVPPRPNGPSIGSLVAGIGSIVVSFVVICFGLAGVEDGWGPTVAGAFGVLAAFIGLGAIGLGVIGLRQIRRGGPSAPTGRGTAVAGIICGCCGVALTLLAIVASILATVGAS